MRQLLFLPGQITSGPTRLTVCHYFQEIKNGNFLSESCHSDIKTNSSKFIRRYYITYHVAKDKSSLFYFFARLFIKGGNLPVTKKKTTEKKTKKWR